MSDPTDDMARRIADCLEKHLPEFGFEPYRYPSGENKSIHMFEPRIVSLFAADGTSWRLEVTGLPATTTPTDPAQTGPERVREPHETTTTEEIR